MKNSLAGIARIFWNRSTCLGLFFNWLSVGFLSLKLIKISQLLFGLLIFQSSSSCCGAPPPFMLTLSNQFFLYTWIRIFIAVRYQKVQGNCKYNGTNHWANNKKSMDTIEILLNKIVPEIMSKSLKLCSSLKTGGSKHKKRRTNLVISRQFGDSSPSC